MFFDLFFRGARWSPALSSLLGTTLLCHATSLSAAEVEWPQFRGPAGDGISQATDIPAQWSETQNVVWKTPLPGKGYSSPVIAGNQIWMTTGVAEPVSEEEKTRRLKQNTGGQPLQVVGRLVMRALCVDLQSGKLIHDIELMTEDEPQPTHAMNSFASPTPVLHAGRLYCNFGASGTAAVDTQAGKVLWTNREHRIQHENGAGSSPIIIDNLLVFHCDGSDLQYITALATSTGETVWKTPRSGAMNDNPQLKKAYGTPIVLETAQGTQIISPAADWLYVYDAAKGKELSKTSYGVLGFSIVPKPVYAHGLVYMSTSFMRPEILAFKYDGQNLPTIAWRFAKQAPTMASPLVLGDEFYMVSDKGVATCLNAKTGEMLWTERMEGNYSASPLFADGKILFCSHEGRTTVVEPGKTYKAMAVNSLEGAILASPVAVGTSLFIRTDKALYRIGKENQ